MDGASFTLLDSLSSIVIVLNIGEPAFVSAFTAFESSCNDLATVVRKEVSIDPSTCIKIRYDGTLCIVQEIIKKLDRISLILLL